MEKKILNIALDNMELENSESEENFETICPTSCCKTIKMLLLDIAEMNEKLSYVKDLEKKLTKLEIKSSLVSEMEQSLVERVKDKDDIIAALKASIEIYQKIKPYETKPNKELGDIKEMLKKLTETTEVHGKQTKPEDLYPLNDASQMNKNQREYTFELEKKLMDANSQLRTKDVQITQQTTALQQKTKDIAKLKADLNTYKQRTGKKLQSLKTYSNQNLIQLKSANAKLTKSKAKIVELEELLKKSKDLNFEQILATKNALLKDRDNLIHKLKSNINGVSAKLKKSKLDNEAQLKHLNDQLTNANALIDTRNMEIHKLKKLLYNAGKNKNEYCEPSLSYQVLHIDGIKSFVATYDSNHDDSLVPSWIIIQRRINGTVTFDRFWTDYSKGFGENKSEFWLGLEKLHALTLNKRHELYIYLVDFYNQVRYARYDDFAIASEEEKYELKSLGKYTGNSGDIMRKYEGKAFDIQDSCGGWWYSKKYETHLNGIYFNEKSMEHEKGLHFGNWYFGSSIPIKYVRMLIRAH